MASGLMKRRWRAALAAVFMLAAATPAAAQVQQPPAPTQHGYLGAELRGLTREDAQTLGLPIHGGATITKVEAGSAAASAGLKRGDILLEIDGKRVASAAQVLKLIAGKMPGTVVSLRVLRQGRPRAGAVKLGGKPEEPDAPPALAVSEVPDPVQQRRDAPPAKRVNDPAAQDKLLAEVVPQMGHRLWVKSVAFSPNGHLALSGGGGDTALKLWDVATGKELRSFIGHTNAIESVAFSPDGRFALSGSCDAINWSPQCLKGSLKLWDVATGKELRSFSGHAGSVSSVSFSPDGRFALSGSSDKTLKLWDVATGKEMRNFPGHTAIKSVVFSPDGRFALSGGYDADHSNDMKLWDVATGKELRSFSGHTKEVNSVAFSADGRFALSGSWDKTLKLWEVATGKEIRSFSGHTGSVNSVAFSADGRFALSGSLDETLKLWEVATGKELRSIGTGGGPVAFSADGRFALSGSQDSTTMKLWEVATGKELRNFSGHTESVTSVAFSADGRFALSGSWDKTLKLWEVATGKELRSFTGHTESVTSVAFSADGRFALSGSWDKTLKLWDVATGKELRSLGGHTDTVESVAFSADGRFALSGSCGGNDYEGCDKGSLKLWDVTTGKELRSFSGHIGDVWSVAFSPDGRFALSGSCDETVLSSLYCNEGSVKLWETATGKELRSFRGHTDYVSSVAFSPDGRFVLSGSWDKTLKLWEAATGKELRSFSGHTKSVTSVAFSPDGNFAVSGSGDHTLKLWELTTGKELRSFNGHTGSVSSVAFSPDGRFALSGSQDGTTRIWDVERGQELARMMATRGDEWLTIAPSGFFSASHRDTDMLAIVRGVESVTIGQVHQSLFNPDLVVEALAGDPGGEVKRAAEVVSLEKVLDAGPPPIAAITSHAVGSQSSADLVTVAARITDGGRGIGRIEWRVNGVTAGVMGAPAGPGPDYEVKEELALDPGENRIEVIAYEGRNLLASLPAQTTIVYNSPADAAKPKLYILAIGINKYVDRGGKDPATGQLLLFPPLTASVPDAASFGAELEKAGAGQYETVRVTLALDENATLAKLDETFGKLAREIGPRDTFVFYAAAHGYTVGGNYYMIPQDYQGGPSPRAIKTRAIGQERIQDWIANRIKAKKAIILLDTCESGALIGGYTKSRTEGPVSEAAMGRLHEATGRPVLTAASPGKSAYENYKGHGVFTYALMEALHLGDTNNNGKIEVTELAEYVERRVPVLFAELKQGGWVVKGLTPAPVRRGEGGEEDKTQTAHFGSTGEDFAVVARLP